MGRDRPEDEHSPRVRGVRHQRTCFRYQATLPDENAEIADWLLRLTSAYRDWGFGLFFCTCPTSRASAGITSASIASIASWS